MANNGHTKDGLAQHYIDDLVKSLKAAEDTLKVANVYYSSASFAFNEVKSWEDLVKRYWENIQKSEDLADAVVRELKKLDDQTDRISSNAREYVEAVSILVCSIKRVVYVLERISNEFNELMTRIKCVQAKEPSLDSSKSILKCLEEYRVKMEAALKAAMELTTLALNLLKTANLVFEEKRAVQSYITYLWEVGGHGGDSDYDCKPTYWPEEDCGNNCYRRETEDNVCEVKYESPCEPIYDCPTLELEDSTYFKDTREEKGNAKDRRKEMEKELTKAQQVRDAALTKRDAALRALDKAKAAKECK